MIIIYASSALIKATAISVLNNKFIVDIVNGNGAELLKDALSKQQRSFLVLDHRSIHIVQDGISNFHIFERDYRPLVNVPACCHIVILSFDVL